MIKLGKFFFLVVYLMSGMKNADADMQEEIDAYISKGSATFGVLIIVCTDNFSLVALFHVLRNFKS